MSKSKDEHIRSYFDYRYSIPGFSFIFLILIINNEFILNFISNSDVIQLFGIILGFISSGPAIGFIVSQLWHAIYNRFLRYRQYLDKFQELRNILYNNEIQDINSLHTTKTLFITTQICDDIKTYLDRRNDIYFSLGSTLTSIILASIIGYSIRKFILNESICIIKHYDILIISIVIMFSIVIRYNLIYILNENDNMIKLMIRLKENEFIVFDKTD